MGFFTVIGKLCLDDVELGDRFEESDFSTVTPQGKFIQMKYNADKHEKRSIEIEKGVWKITIKNQQLCIEPAEFANNSYLEGIGDLPKLDKAISSFFNRIHVYRDLGFEVPKRGALLYGPPGAGKTASIAKVLRKFDNAAILIWDTTSFESVQAKQVLESLVYKDVDQFILVMEDLGGVEVQDRSLASDSTLLTLLDNSQKTFTIPTFIVSTTNYPEMFMENLTNRPDRFDDKIEVGHLPHDAQLALLRFFLKEDTISEELTKLLKTKCEKFTPAHIRELVVKSKLHDKTLEETCMELITDIVSYEKAFQKRRSSLGF